MNQGINTTNDGIYTVTQAARELGVSTTAIYLWLKSGRLRRVPIAIHGRLHLVDSASVVALKQRRDGESAA